MEEHGGFGFDDFSVEIEDFEYKLVKKFDRIFNLGEGGSFLQWPFLYEGRVYVACLDRNVYCLDGRTGGLVWKFTADGGFAPASPMIDEGIVYIGSYDYNLYALDARTGGMIWKYHTQGKLAGNATIHGSRVFVGSNDYNMYCLDAKTGEFIWKFRTQGEVPSKPTFHDGMVLFGSYDRFFYCVDEQSGRLIWKFETQGDVYNEDDVLIHEGVVYFPSFDNFLRAVDIKTGRMLWKFRTGNYGGMHSGPRMAGDRLIQVNREGVMHALTFGGKVIWKFRINQAMALPMIHDGKIYVGTEDENLYCIDLEGNVLWKFKTQGSLWWKPTIWEEKVLFTSHDCNVYCVDINTHQLLWKFRGQGAPSYFPPPFDSYELTVKKAASESGLEEKATRKRYDFGMSEEETTSQYKSKITYQISTQYASKGKYQIDSDEEAL
ncbi:MAG: PQQ-binding-like beta-propeller repeat protein [Candidatus Aenigmarchaeota archaeon]|nr:PQQ-binding-like beta-propeller repeat protein [Candidatus Aenigmarchaeota archaeon]